MSCSQCKTSAHFDGRSLRCGMTCLWTTALDHKVEKKATPIQIKEAIINCVWHCQSLSKLHSKVHGYILLSSSPIKSLESAAFFPASSSLLAACSPSIFSCLHPVACIWKKNTPWTWFQVLYPYDKREPPVSWKVWEGWEIHQGLPLLTLESTEQISCNVFPFKARSSWLYIWDL